MKSNFWRKAAAVTLTCALLVPTLAACSNGNNENADKERVLRIASTMGGGPDDEWFRTQFTELYEFSHPNIKIEIIPAVEYNRYEEPTPDQKQPDPVENLKKLMTGANPPDLIMASYEQLPELIQDNMLKKLDPLMTEDKFDVGDFVPAVIDGLRDIGEGDLYALAPTFYSSALIYNKKMFTDAGVEFPADDMTWDDIFNLARRVAKGEGDQRVYGFGFNKYQGSNTFYDMDIYTAPLQLSIFDEKGEKLTVDSDAWERVWNAMIQLRTEKLLPEPPDYSKPQPANKKFNPFEYDNFLSGKVAMAVISYYDLNEIINVNRDAQAGKIKDFQPIDWDVVTVPTHAEYPGIGGNIWMNGVAAINSKAQNDKDAWDFIKFMNGEDWAKLKSKSTYNLVSRKSYIKPKDGLDYNIDAFTKLKPPQLTNDAKLYQTKPNLWQVRDIGAQKFQLVLDKKKTVREALKEWQTEGNTMLQKLKDNPNGPIPMEPMDEKVTIEG